MKKKIYQWHRTISLIIAIPVILWAASGFMHPIMTNIRPKVATQWLVPQPIDSAKIKVSLQAALQLNKIDSFTNFRLVHIDNNWFYQVQRGKGKEPVYLATLTGKLLTGGDWLYAQYLAKQFLEGQTKDSGINATMHAEPTVTLSSFHDCCDAATDAVLNPVKGSKVKDASALNEYNTEYKSINRLLPVYKVAFDRPDGIRIYVETAQDRFAFAMDNKRKVFDRLFVLIHTWGWLEFLGKGKLVVEFILVFLAFLTTVMGIYIFFTSKSKKVPGNPIIKSRRNHRYTSIIISLFTLMFTFSGAYHALDKFKEDTRDQFYTEHAFYTASTDFNFPQIQSIAKTPVLNISLVNINGKNYWRVIKKQGPANFRKDLMKDAMAPMPATVYISTSSNSVLPDGELVYAKFLASQFSSRQPGEIVSAEPVTKFTSDYNFTDKRLPVWKISYNTDHHERLFVETSTGKLSKRVNDIGLLEDYSFAFLHKHEFMGWAGKSWKDFSTMFWAMAQIAMVAIGLIFYFKLRKAKANRNDTIN
jgi:hypothetical protein